MKRERLFRKSRPLIRKYEPADAGFLWAAYKNGSFPIPEGLSQTDFLKAMAEKFGSFNLVWIIEDDTKRLKAGRGQVALVGIKSDGWTYEPSAFFFKWATPKNVLRSMVGFFQMIRYQKDVGVCVVRSTEFRTLNRMKSYGVLFLRGKIPSGDRKGDLFIFSIQGKKNP